jgi:hypothetical protein
MMAVLFASVALLLSGPGNARAGSVTVSERTVHATFVDTPEHYGSGTLAPPRAVDDTFVVDRGAQLDVYGPPEGQPYAAPYSIVFYIYIERYLGVKEALLATPHLLPSFAELHIYAWDVNRDCPTAAYKPCEVDEVYLNGNKVTLPKPWLWGGGSEWEECTFKVPMAWLNFPTLDENGSVVHAINQVEVRVDVANPNPYYPNWRTEVDWAYLTFPAPHPLLLFNGILAGPGMWDEQPFSWRDKLQEMGYPVTAPALDPIGGVFGNAATVVTKVISEANKWNVQRVDVVGHSKGGLDALFGTGLTPGNVANLVQLGTPNLGSPLAAYWLKFFRGASAVLPIQRDLLPPVATFFSRTALHSPSTRYTAIAGDLTPSAAIAPWWLWCQLITGYPSDAVVPVNSVHGLPYMGHETFASDSMSACHVGLNAYPEPFEDVWQALGHPSTLAAPSPNVARMGNAVAEAGQDGAVTDTTRSGNLALGDSVTVALESDPDTLRQVQLVYAGGRVRVLLVSPTGTVVNEENAGANGVSFIGSEELLGMGATTILLPLGATGRWECKLRADSVASGLTAVGFALTPVRAPLTCSLVSTVSAGAKQVGSTFPVQVTLAGAQLGGASDVHGSLAAEGVAATGFVLRDDGTGGDLTANDGVFSGSAGPVASAGSYSLRCVAAGTASGGGSFSREQVISVDVGRGTALRNETYDASGGSPNHSWYQWIDVAVPISVTAAGRVVCQATLSDSAGHTEFAVADSTLGIGDNSIMLRFDGHRIYQNGVDGVFRLLNVMLYDGAGTSGILVDSRDEIALPGEWSHGDFVRDPFYIVGGGHEEEVDADGDCLADSVRVAINMDLGVYGPYTATAALTDTAGFVIDAASSSLPWCDRGPGNWFSFDFSAEKIARARRAGPLEIRSLVLVSGFEDGPKFRLSNEAVAYRLAPTVASPTSHLAGRIASSSDTLTACPSGDGDSLAFSIDITGMCGVDLSRPDLTVIAIRRNGNGEDQGVKSPTFWDAARPGASQADTLVAVSYDPSVKQARFLQQRISGAGAVDFDVIVDGRVVAHRVEFMVRSYDINRYCFGAVDRFDQAQWDTTFGVCQVCRFGSYGDFDKDDTTTASGDRARLAAHLGHSVRRTIVTPNGGEDWAYGSFPTSNWKRGLGDSSYVSLSLVRDGWPGWKETLAQDLPDLGSRAVPLYTTQAGQTDFRMVVEHWDGKASLSGRHRIGADSSDAVFTIESAAGGCPIVDSRTLDGWVEENTILGRSLMGEAALDAYRLKWPWPIDGTLNLRIREDEDEVTSLDQLRLIAIDHRPGLEAFASGDRVVLGTRLAARSVRSSTGTDITSQLRGGGYSATADETLYVEQSMPASLEGFRADPAGEEEPFLFDDGGGKGGVPQLAARPASSSAADAEVLSSTGVLIQVPNDAGGWESVAHHYPRELPSQALFDSVRATSVRLIFLDAHRVTFLGSVVASADTFVASKLVLRTALHSRLGDVREAVLTAGNVTTSLSRGDTLTLGFDAPAPSTGAQREYFLLSRGVYTTNLPARQLPTPTPRAFALGQNRPNPFSSITSILFDVPQAARVRIDVFDLQGRRVRTLVDRMVEPGAQSVIWNQTDESGVVVHPGVYLYRMQGPQFLAERKMVIVR